MFFAVGATSMFAVFMRVRGMPVRGMGVVSGFLVISGFVVLCGFRVMTRRVLVMFRSLPMVFIRPRVRSCPALLSR